MRFDQYLLLDRSLRILYNVNRKYFITTLPSAREFSRNVIFTGELPVQIANNYPKLFKNISDEESNANRLNISDQDPYFTRVDISTNVQAC